MRPALKGGPSGESALGDGLQAVPGSVPPALEVGQRTLGDRQLALHLAARRSRQRLDDPERDVRRIVVRRVRRARRSTRARQSPSSAAATTAAPPSPVARHSVRPAARRPPTRRSPRRRTSARRRNSVGCAPDLPRLGEHGRPVDVGVAVHHPEPHELGLLESRNQPQHARLLAPFELRLKARPGCSDRRRDCPGAAAPPHTAGRPVRGSSDPTGFIGPNRSVSSPRCAITSIGRQPSKNFSLSKSWTVADSA